MIEIRTNEELEKVFSENENKLVVLKFSGSWCGPCRVLANTIEEIKPDLQDVIFVEADIDEVDSELIEKYKIMNIPVLIFFKDGLQVDKSVGNVPKASLLSMIERNKDS